jgi:stearoyl-CoA desaturase (delta-9 desaturase)
MIDFKRIHWPIFLFISLYQIIVILAAPFYFYFSPPAWGMILALILLISLTEISITAGYHRLYSHKAYKTTIWVELPLVFLGTMAGQGSVLRWANDHRLHHKHVDTDLDPYSINKGFWYAHILWLFEKPDPIKPGLVSDLIKNKLLVFQDKYYGILFFLSNALVSAIIGWLLNDYTGAFYLAWWVRLFLVHHSTWFINSLAHTWGSKSYYKELSAVDNYLISMLTFGEGYHNYHHYFESDYRNGVKWYHFDPTKWLIWILNKTGLANNLRRFDEYKIKKQILKNDRNLLIDRLVELSYIKKDELEQRIKDTFDSISEKMKEIKHLRERYHEFKKAHKPGRIIEDIRMDIDKLQHMLSEDIRTWKALFNGIMKMKPIPVL